VRPRAKPNRLSIQNLDREACGKCELHIRATQLKMRLLALTAFVALTMVRASAQVLPNADKINKSVVFIYGAAPDGSPDESRPFGTGFFIQVPIKTRPGKVYFLLATARHVVQPAWAFCPPHTNPAVIYLRVNKKNFVEGQNARGVDFLRVNLASDLATGPEQVDVAIVRINIPITDIYDVDGVPIYYFASSAQMEALSFGDEVATAGLLPVFPGSNRNYPFFKFGRISAIPKEPVPMPCAPNEPARAVQLIFVAMNLVPGNSGSPTFFTPPPFSSRKPAFIGLQSLSVQAADVGGMTSANEVYAIIEKLNLPDADLKRGEVPTEPSPTSPAKQPK
jgi:hypothetical protein